MKTVFMRVQNIGKCNNKSAIAASAYRSGTKMYDATKEKTYNYSSKKEVVYDTIMLPTYAPTEYQNKQTLWQTIQDNETASDARYCKDIMIAIPKNLTQEQRVELVNQFLFKNFVYKGYICQCNIHDKGDGNPHAHILVSARPLDKNGQWTEVKSKRVYKLDKDGNKIPVIDKKTGQQKIGARGRKMWQREWAKQDTLDQASSLNTWKKSWRDICNQVLDKEHQLQVGPEGKHATIHLGPQAHALEKKGIKTHIGEKNQQIKIANRKAELQAALIAIEKKLQKDKEMIAAQKAAVEHLKEIEDYNQYIPGYDLHNNFRQLFATIQIEMQMNQGKIDECAKNLMTDKQISLKAMNIVTNGRILQYRKAKRQIEKEEAKLQQRINTFQSWPEPDGTNSSYKKQYDDESDYLSYTIDNIKKRRKALAEEQTSI
ncbi:MAG: MobA/MobL family protein, partial [Phascolarctobacterium sp.]